MIINNYYRISLSLSLSLSIFGLSNTNQHYYTISKHLLSSSIC